MGRKHCCWPSRSSLTFRPARMTDGSSICGVLYSAVCRATERRSEVDDNHNRFGRGPMVRRNFPDVTFQVVQRDRIWPIWLMVMLGGPLGVFALTALIVSILIQG